MNFISNLYFFWGWGVIMLLPCIVILGIGLDGVFKGEEVGASIGLKYAIQSNSQDYYAR